MAGSALMVAALAAALQPVALTLAAIDDFDSFTRNVSSTLDDLLSESSYDKRLRPDFGGPPTMVEVNMHIKSMGPVHENEQTYLMDVYFRQTWVDSRLKWEVPGLDEFSMSWLFLEKVWKPDTYFLNGKKSHLHRITSPNKFLRLRTDGFITYSMRLTIAAKCKMHLKKFPLDTQKCTLIIGSFGYTTEDLVYIWSPKGVSVEDKVEMAQYNLSHISTKDNKFATKGKEEYSVVIAEFELKRTIGFFVLQIYVPCSLIVCCSWVSFWITPGDVPGRVSLAVTTVLSITTLGFGGRSQLPQVSHATALDWWVIFCFAFVFAVMIEYAIINFTDKMRTDLRKLIEQRDKTAEEKKAEKLKEKERGRLEKEKKKEEKKKEADGVPQIQIEVTQYLDESDSPSELQEETKLLQNMTETKVEEPKKQAVARFLDVEVAGPSKVNPQKRWRSVPNVLAPEHLQGVKGEDWLKTVEAMREAKGWKGLLRRLWRAPVVWWRNFHLMPTEEDIKNMDPDRRFTKMDIIARRAFPLAFSTFVVSYTLLYAYYFVDEALEEHE